MWGPVRCAGTLLATVTGVLAAQGDSTAPLRRALLDTLHVELTRQERPVAQVPYAVAALTADDLTRGRAALGLDEALAAVPGILVSNRYNPALDQRVAIRGFGARSAFGVRGVKIVLDGIPQTLPDGQGQLTNVELEDLARVEILRGASSALYGNASGGVLLLRSRTARPARPGATAGLVAGSFGLLKWSLRAASPAGAGSVQAIATRTVADGFRDHSRADRRHLGLRLVHPVGRRSRLAVRVSVADDPEAENPGALTRDEAAERPAQAAPANVAADARKDVSQVQVGAELSHRLRGGGTLEGAAFALWRELENPLAFGRIALDRRVVGGRASLGLPVGAAGTLTVGVDLQAQRDDRVNRTPDGATVTLDQLERVWELGPFVQAVVPVGSRTAVTGGLRYDRIRFSAADRLLADGDDSGSRVMDAVSGSAGVTVRLHDGFAPYVSVGTSFESPTTTELVNRPDGGGGFDPALEPQRTLSVELGARGTVGGALDYAVTVFRARVTDELIPFESAQQPGRRFFRNAGSARHAGLELGVDWRPAARVGVVAAYTYADYAFDEFRTQTAVFDGKRIPGVPRHYLHWSVRYRSRAGVWAAVDQTYSSTVPVDDGNTARADAWLVASIRLGWRRALGTVTLAPFVGVLNLFDRRYAGSVVVNASGGRFYEPAPGRNLVVGLRVGAAGGPAAQGPLSQ